MDFSSSPKAASCLVKRLQQQQAGASSSSSSTLLPAAQLLSSTLMAKPCFLPEDVEAPVQTLLLAAGEEAARWDCLCVGLLVCNDAVVRMAPAPAVSPALRETLYSVIAQHLEHDEPRVRGLVAKTLGLLCTLPAVGTDAYVRFQAQLWASVDSQLTRRATETRPTNLGAQKDIPLDDVTGWRALETSLLALQAVVEGCGPELVRQGFLAPTTEWLDKAVYAAAAHPNRYVREAAMNMVRVLVERCYCEGGKEVLLLPALAAVVAEGLADAWPQVVYAAARATRSLLTATKGSEVLFCTLLPPLCQGRYYVPEGVQVHAQETWMGLFAAAGAASAAAGAAAGAEGGEGTSRGREAVARYVREMVEHHCHAVGQGRSHFARVAACYALKELVAKVEGKAVAPHVEGVLGVVLPCLEDPHWEVRSAGCVALAQLTESFPAVVVGREEEVMRACSERLGDESWSIREEAAEALAALARHGGERKEEVLSRLVARLAASLEAARVQSTQTRDEQLREFNDPKAHTGRPIFGCCGGMVVTAAAAAAAAHAHTHAPAYQYTAQPWEVSEGALYLFRELCAEDLCPTTTTTTTTSGANGSGRFAETYLPVVAELGRLQHFAEADRLRQTLWKVLPQAMQRLGKPVLKRHLELFTPALLGALASPVASPLTHHAAVTCLEELSQQMGPSIFLGRLSENEQGLFLRNASSSSSSSSAAASFRLPSVAAGATMRQSRPSIVSM